MCILTTVELAGLLCCVLVCVYNEERVCCAVKPHAIPLVKEYSDSKGLSRI